MSGMLGVLTFLYIVSGIWAIVLTLKIIKAYKFQKENKGRKFVICYEPYSGSTFRYGVYIKRLTNYEHLKWFDSLEGAEASIKNKSIKSIYYDKHGDKISEGQS